MAAVVRKAVSGSSEGETPMNFLAHLFLDSSSDDALLGSLLGDFVKGDTKGRFRAAVSDAILLQRKALAMAVKT